MRSPAVAVTIDLEDAHHGLRVPPGASSFEADSEWILEALSCADVKATFFVLGEIGERYPRVVAQIAAEGHEIALHGPTHEFLRNVDPRVFERELIRAVARREDFAGARVLGFRAAFFSLAPDTAWCLDVLARHGFTYDASIYPARNDRYGWPAAPCVPVRHARTGLVLFPVPLMHRLLPVGFSGGAYLRILPWTAIRWALSRQAARGEAGMIYFHPWEIAASLEWRRDAGLRANLTRHAFRQRMRGRVVRALVSIEDRAGPMADVLNAIADDIELWSPAAQGMEPRPRMRPGPVLNPPD